MDNLDPEDIKAVMTRVCDLQLENLKNSVIKNEHIIWKTLKAIFIHAQSFL